jgi:hypothetical protein
MPDAPPSFSAARKWNLSLSVLVSLLALTALVGMANYLAARHYARGSWSGADTVSLSPLTRRVLEGVTNEVKVTLYYDREEPLFDLCRALLKEYQNANRRLAIEHVDYHRDPGAAQLLKTRHKLHQSLDRDLVLFECQGRTKVVYQSELSDIDVQGLTSGQAREVRRTHFKGEMHFTAALLGVVTPRQLKAYFLQGHGEHRPDSDEAVAGYAKFGSVLRQNSVQFESLSLATVGETPADCNLLIIAGPRDPFLPEELEKIDRYLKQGGRLLVLFNFASAWRELGLEKLLAQWGVEAGLNVVLDPKQSVSNTGNEMIVSHLGTHPLIRPFYDANLLMVLPRSIRRAEGAERSGDAPQVTPLAFTSPEGRIITNIRNDPRTGPAPYLDPRDFIGTVPLMVAVEKGGIRGVAADRGATRLVVVGDSLCLGNNSLDRMGNREFASHAVNWLLARHELLGGLGPKPIKEFKLTMTASQLTQARWLLLAGMPGAVLAAGFVVWARRRR